MSEDAHETPQPIQAETLAPPPIPAHADDKRLIPISELFSAHTRTLPSGRTFTRNRCRVCGTYWDNGHPPEMAHQIEEERHQPQCPLRDDKLLHIDPIPVAQAEYNYWRQFMEDENPNTADNAMGACGAAANIIGGLIRRQIKPKDDPKARNISELTAQLYASEALLLSGGVQQMINDLRAQLTDRHFAASTSPRLADLGAGAEAYQQALNLLDAFEARMNAALLLLPAA